MSSSTLFKIAGGIFALLPIGHTQMYFDTVAPGLQEGSTAAYSGKVSWTQANGYFIASALLCFKWANEGISDGLDKYIFGALFATHSFASLMYARKGVPAPALIYFVSNLLLGIAAWKGT